MKTTFKFTAARLAALPVPEGGEATYYDADTSGLSVRVRPTGGAAYGVRYRITGDNRGPQRLTLGAVGVLPLAEARLQAQAALVAAKQGRDPTAERRAAGAALAMKPKATLSALINAHERDQSAHGVISAAANAKSLRREFAAMLNCDPATLTRAEIVRVLDRVRNGVPGHAAPRPGAVANLRARVHGLLSWAENSGQIPSNVMAGYRSKRRSRAERLEALEARSGGVMLDMPEIAALWRACDDARIRGAFGSYVKLLLLTGCRRNELAQARLGWITTARGDQPALMTIPAGITKNGKPHVIPLPPLAAAVIASTRRFADTDLITPGARSKRTGKSAPISGWSKSWPRLLKAAEGHGLKRKFTPHDLRRSFRSHLARLGVADRVAERMLNHTPTDRLISIYDRHDYLAEKVGAAAKWADAVSAALTEPPPALASVITLRPAAKARRRPAPVEAAL
jgi:integrase